MNEVFAIRTTTPADLEQILHHRRSMFRDDGYSDEPMLDAIVTNSRTVIERGLREGSYRGWFAVSDGMVVAGVGLMISAWPAGPTGPHKSQRAYILNVYTEPEFRGRGISTTLMQAAVEHCRAEGFATVWLHATEAGRRVYEKVGFKSTNEMKLALEER